MVIVLPDQIIYAREVGRPQGSGFDIHTQKYIDRRHTDKTVTQNSQKESMEKINT